MTQEEIRTKVHQFIRKNFLLGSGVVDSTGILELISFLEDTCRIKFEDNELVADNFDTVNRISSFVAQKLA